MRQLTSLDAQFLALETPRTYGHVGGLAVYDPITSPLGSVEREDICRLLSERLHLLPPFRQRLVEVPFGLDDPYWIEDPDFDIDFHVRETAVPPPGDRRRLADLVARIVARPLDRSHPLWELYLIHGLERGRTAVLTKVHHSAVDGLSGAEILSILLDPSPEGREIPPPPPRNAERVPSQAEMLARGVAALPRQPLRAARALPSTLANLEDIPGVGAIPGISLLGRAATELRRALPGGQGQEVDAIATRAPQTRFNGRVSQHRRFSFGSISLERVKAVKNALGITVNDVVMCVCTTALRDWLLERDELPDEPLVAMVPLSTRTPEQAGTFGNRITVMFVPIPTDVADPRERLLRMHETMKVAKTRHRAVPADILQDATRSLPPAVFARATRAMVGTGAIGAIRPLNVVISNVPGPREPLFFAGAKLECHFPVSVIIDGAGLNITCLSYRDHIDFGIVADREQVDDAWPFMEAVSTGLAELDEAICGRVRTGARRSPGTRPARAGSVRA